MNLTCEGCKYKNCDGSTNTISNCISCKRINELAKKNFYKKENPS